jgi:hypothetical protein
MLSSFLFEEELPSGLKTPRERHKRHFMLMLMKTLYNRIMFSIVLIIGTSVSFLLFPSRARDSLKGNYLL